MWRALRTHDIAAWFAQGDNALLEAIMSITGTVIMGEIDTTTSDSPTLTVLHGNQLRLGDVIAGAGGIILVGLVAGIARQSLMAFALGIGGAMGLYNMPTIVETIMSATV